MTCELGAVETGGDRGDTASMQMAMSFLLSPPSPSLPSPAASTSTSYLVVPHHGCGGRRHPPEPRCRCGRSPEITSTSSNSSSGDRDSSEDEETSSAAALRPLEVDGAASSADSETGEPRELLN